MPAALLVAGFTFVLRFLTLRDFANDHFMQLAWAQQVLFGDLPGRDFVDPGMPLTYALSAVTQALWPGPLSEAVLTILLLSIAGAAVTLVVARITRSVGAGIAAGLFAAALQPQLYNYYKLLAPSIALLLLAMYEERRSRGLAAALGAWTVVAFLLRHDVGVYVGIGAAAGVLAVNWRDGRRGARHLIDFSACGALLAVPYLAFVQWSVGVSEYLHQATEFAKSDSHQLGYDWPALALSWLTGFGAGAASGEAASFLFYLAHGLLLLTPFVLFITRWDRVSRFPATVIGAVVMLALYDVVVLRDPVFARLRDLAAPLAVVSAWTFAAMVAPRWPPAWPARFGRGVVAVLGAALIAWSAAGAWQYGKVGDRIEDARLLDGPGKMWATAQRVLEATSATAWPWPAFWPTHELPAAVEYINQCTDATDRVLVTWSAPEYYYFARRPFAAGHAMFLPPRAFVADRDQAVMLARLDRHPVPLVLVNETQQEEFARAYTQVDDYIKEQYEPVGRYENYDGSTIVIAARKGISSSATYGPDEWPCAFR